MGIKNWSAIKKLSRKSSNYSENHKFVDEKIKKSLQPAGIDPKLAASKALMLSNTPQRVLQLSTIENYLKRKKVRK